MYKIMKAEKLADKIFLMDVHAPRVASHCEPGQFVIVKMDEKGERIPLTICDYDREAGTITIVVQEVGASTTKMGTLKEGDYFRDFTGPLGCASEFVHEDLETLKNKKMLFVAGGVGAAPVYPQVKWLKEHGIEADVIVGAKTKDMLILEDEMKAVAGNYYPCTDDGTYGHAGMVTTMIEKLVNEGKKYPPKEDYRTDETILKVEHLCSIHERSFQDCSFELKRGEILGFGGLVGAQRTEMMEAIFGMRHIASGTVEVLGKKVNIKKPEDAIANSIGMITEDRRGTGILGCLSINDNTAIASYKNYTNSGVIDQKKVDAVVKDSIQKLNIKTPSGKTLIQSLSGGNQQKVIIARWLANNPDILIMDEPTRGIDVGAKYEIYQIMIDLVKQGKSIIMISSEMPELIGMSNRIIVMCNGHITGEVEGEEATQERIMSFATQFDLQGKSTTESK